MQLDMTSLHVAFLFLSTGGSLPRLEPWSMTISFIKSVVAPLALAAEAVSTQRVHEDLLMSSRPQMLQEKDGESGFWIAALFTDAAVTRVSLNFPMMRDEVSF